MYVYSPLLLLCLCVMNDAICIVMVLHVYLSRGCFIHHTHFLYTHPSCTPSNLLVLQLTDSGELPYNDITVSHETLQLLRIL